MIPTLFRTGAALAALFLSVSACVPAGRAQAGEARTVRSVWDGDTFVLENGEKVRLIGVDTPEFSDPGRNDDSARRNNLDAKTVQAFAKEAKNYARGLVEGRKVRLEYDPLQKKDKYGRTLAYVYRAEDELHVNAEIIRQGFGFPIQNFPYLFWDEFRRYRDEARAAGRGLWKKG